MSKNQEYQEDHAKTNDTLLEFARFILPAQGVFTTICHIKEGDKWEIGFQDNHQDFIQTQMSQASRSDRETYFIPHSLKGHAKTYQKDIKKKSLDQEWVVEKNMIRICRSIFAHLDIDPNHKEKYANLEEVLTDINRIEEELGFSYNILTSGDSVDIYLSLFDEKFTYCLSTTQFDEINIAHRAALSCLGVKLHHDIENDMIRMMRFPSTMNRQSEGYIIPVEIHRSGKPMELAEAKTRLKKFLKRHDVKLDGTKSKSKKKSVEQDIKSEPVEKTEKQNTLPGL